MRNTHTSSDSLNGMLDIRNNAWAVSSYVQSGPKWPPVLAKLPSDSGRRPPPLPAETRHTLRQTRVSKATEPGGKLSAEIPGSLYRNMQLHRQTGLAATLGLLVPAGLCLLCHQHCFATLNGRPRRGHRFRFPSARLGVKLGNLSV